MQMHSYDNGISLPKKLSNWALLEKFFMKKRVPIPRHIIDDVIHCKNDAVNSPSWTLICFLYVPLWCVKSFHEYLLFFSLCACADLP